MSNTAYKHRVLGIETPVSVVLASRAIPLEEVLEMTTGTMLAFDKGCDEALTLEVGGQRIATGEAVKVGDKFGMRVRNVEALDED